MKLILAIVNNDDSALVSSALTKDNFTVTRLSTTGGFLMVGNTTLLIGSEDNRVERAKEIIAEHCHTRKQVNPTSQSFGTGLRNEGVAKEISVGGATVFVLCVESFDKV